MGRRSSIDRLDPDIREKIGDLIDRGHTIDEVMEHLDLLTRGVSRSALGRHARKISAMAQEARRSAEMAEALVKRYADAPEDRTQRLNLHLMHGICNRLMISEDGEAVTLDPKEAHMLSSTLANLARARRQDVLAARDAKALRELRDRMSDAVGETAEQLGLGADLAESLRVAMTKVPA